MAFPFRFEKLLSYRFHLKEMAEINVSIARNALAQAQEVLQEYQGHLRQAEKELALGLKNKISSQLVKSFIEYRAVLENTIRNQARTVGECEEEVSKTMECLLARSQEYKVIEKLKEKDFKKWKHRQLQAEQKEMAETAIVRHGRNFL